MWSRRTKRFWNPGSEEAERSKWGKYLRMYAMEAMVAAMFVVLLYRLWDLQIVNGGKYAEDFELKITRTVRESNTRGRIYDCNGEVLAYNKPVYTVTMVDQGNYASTRERQLILNSTIYRVMKKLEENGETFAQELRVRVGENGRYEYTVTGNSLARFQADIFGLADIEDLTDDQLGITAEELIEYLAGETKFALYGDKNGLYTEAERVEYGLPETYTKQEILTLTGVRYSLSLNAYRKYVPVTLARNISERTAVYLLENNQSLPGIEVGQDWERVYTGGEAFSHILGYTGKISAEELKQYNDGARESGDKAFAGAENTEKRTDYTVDSMVGKAGIEQFFEPVLQGIDGQRQIMVNNTGKILGDGEVLQEMVSGRDIYLTIDKGLQEALYHVLEQNLAGILLSNLINAKEFDRTSVADSSDIRIPIYDVYLALIDNSVIKMEEFEAADATPLEREMGERLEEKRKEVWDALKAELLENHTACARLTEEMQEYVRLLVDESGVLKESAITEDEVYLEWKSGSISAGEFLVHAIESGWVITGKALSEQQYFTTQELYLLLVEEMEKRIEDNTVFEKMLFKWMIREERVTGAEVCLLLYDQEVLALDDDREALVSGALTAFSFIKKKIGQLEITPAQLALDPCSASAVVVQPGTGKVLALVSYPGYDNNRLANQIDSAYYNSLLNDKSLPLYNRATQQLTAPGSTFKPVTIIAGLMEGTIRPDSSVHCDGVFDRVTPSLKCWNHYGHGNVPNAATALQFSCNDYMCEIAYRLGMTGNRENAQIEDKSELIGCVEEGGNVASGYMDDTALSYLQKYAVLFGLDEKSGVEITESQPHVTDAYGIPSSIGQGTHNYATVQLARYANTFASGGDMFSLSLLEGIADEAGEPHGEKRLPEGTVELPDSVWETVRLGMIQFAQNNAVLRDIEISVAGKTGTAQESDIHPDHVLFVGYAPAENPEITVAVRIANGYGASNATAVGRSIFDYYFGLKSPEEIVTGRASHASNTRSD